MRLILLCLAALLLIPHTLHAQGVRIGEYNDQGISMEGELLDMDLLPLEKQYEAVKKKRDKRREYYNQERIRRGHSFKLVNQYWIEVGALEEEMQELREKIDEEKKKKRAEKRAQKKPAK